MILLPEKKKDLDSIHSQVKKKIKIKKKNFCKTIV